MTLITRSTQAISNQSWRQYSPSPLYAPQNTKPKKAKKTGFSHVDSFGSSPVTELWEGACAQEGLLSGQQLAELMGCQIASEFQSQIDVILNEPALRAYLTSVAPQFEVVLPAKSRSAANKRVLQHSRIAFFVSELLRALDASGLASQDKRTIRAHLNQIARELCAALEPGEPDDTPDLPQIESRAPRTKKSPKGRADLPDLVMLGKRL